MIWTTNRLTSQMQRLANFIVLEGENKGSDDWSNCAVDVPDTSCHWYVANADNTFGDGFDWETAPWYSVEGLQDVANLHDQVLSEGHQYTVESLQK